MKVNFGAPVDFTAFSWCKMLYLIAHALTLVKYFVQIKEGCVWMLLQKHLSANGSK